MTAIAAAEDTSVSVDARRVRIALQVHEENIGVSIDATVPIAKQVQALVDIVEKRLEECHVSINFRLESREPLTITPGERAGFVEADQLNHFIASRLIWLQDSLSPQILEHSVVRIVGRPNLRDISQCELEAAKRHQSFFSPAESVCCRGKENVQFVADEAESCIGARRGRVLDPERFDRRDLSKCDDEQFCKGAFARPAGCFEIHRRA